MLTYAVAGDLPPGVTFDAATGLFGGTVAASAPARSYEVTVTATDVTGSNTGVSDTFLFNVTGGGVDTRPTVRIEAEDGTLVDGFFIEKGERIRLLADDDGTATYDLSGNRPGRLSDPDRLFRRERRREHARRGGLLRRGDSRSRTGSRSTRPPPARSPASRGTSARRRWTARSRSARTAC